MAGSTLALILARVGLDVAIVEREARYRDRVRGDCLFPWGAAIASRLGISAVLPESGAKPLPIWQVYERGEARLPYAWQTDVPTGDVVWGVDLPVLEETLIREAEAAGAHVVRPAKGLCPFRRFDGRLTVALEGAHLQEQLDARLVVGADGSASGARAWIGATTNRDPLHHMLGGCLLAGVDLDPDATHVSRIEGGMLLIFRHGDGRARAYFVCRPETARAMRGREAATPFLRVLERAFPQGTFARARTVGPAAFFPGVDVFADRLAGDGVVLIGDAAGANDPAQGQGISLALRDVEELSHVLLTNDDWQGAIDDFASPPTHLVRTLASLCAVAGTADDGRRSRGRCGAKSGPARRRAGSIPNGLRRDSCVGTGWAARKLTRQRRRFLGERYC